MLRVPPSPPIIAPLSCNGKRPIVSVMIPVYNCSNFLSDTITSVLLQDLGEDLMQIEVIDDASTDADVEELVKNLGNGRVQYFRQPNNMGSLRNFETCINRAKGEVIHLLHGDDRVKFGFYSKILSLFELYPEIGAAFCNYHFITEEGKISKDFILGEKEDGVLQNWLIRIAEFQKIQYVSMVVRREVYERLGSYYGMSYGEDWEMWVRIAKNYPVAHSPEVLAEYRTRLGSITWEKSTSGDIYNNLTSTMTIIQDHLPMQSRKRVLKISKKHCANYLMGMAITRWITTKNFLNSQRLVYQALSFSKNTYIFIRIIKFYVFVGVFKILGR